MKIINYRRSFAANSSSTHSTFFVEEPGKVIERIYDSFCFGWEPFVLKSRPMVDRYIAAQIKSCLNNTLPKELRLAFINEVIPSASIVMEEFDELEVDHQSVWGFPYDYHAVPTALPSMDFVKDLVKYLQSKNTVIYGGNDNAEYCIDIDCKYTESSAVSSLMRVNSSYSSEYVCVKDVDNNFWTLINKEDGERIIISFDDNCSTPTKSSIPLLVDLIISDRCYNNCPYCYRNCNQNGGIASIGAINNYLEALYDLGVMEVAIGGGDILTYPYLDDLLDIVQRFREKNMIINTTLAAYSGTMCSNQIKDYIIRQIVDTFNSVAFSVQNGYHYNCVKKYFNKTSSIQLIPELMKDYEHRQLSELLDAEPNLVTTTFLGFKETGRASDRSYLENNERIIKKNREEFKNWIHMYRRGCTINIDTQLIKNIPAIKNELEKWMYNEIEGSFSCCINAINDTIMKSSYDYNCVYPIGTDVFKFAQSIADKYKNL